MPRTLTCRRSRTPLNFALFCTPASLFAAKRCRIFSSLSLRFAKRSFSSAGGRRAKGGSSRARSTQRSPRRGNSPVHRHNALSTSALCATSRSRWLFFRLISPASSCARPRRSLQAPPSALVANLEPDNAMLSRVASLLCGTHARMGPKAVQRGGRARGSGARARADGGGEEAVKVAHRKASRGEERRRAASERRVGKRGERTTERGAASEARKKIVRDTNGERRVGRGGANGNKSAGVSELRIAIFALRGWGGGGKRNGAWDRESEDARGSRRTHRCIRKRRRKMEGAMGSTTSLAPFDAILALPRSPVTPVLTRAPNKARGSSTSRRLPA